MKTAKYVDLKKPLMLVLSLGCFILLTMMVRDSWGQSTSIKPGKLLYVEAGGDTLLITTLSKVDLVLLDSNLRSIQQWIADAVRTKINNRREGLRDLWLPILQADISLVSIPANPDSLILSIARRSDYLTRAQADSLNPGP